MEPRTPIPYRYPCELLGHDVSASSVSSRCGGEWRPWSESSPARVERHTNLRRCCSSRTQVLSPSRP
ncbi:hypothetical protein BKA56DRAFT_196542 [Ilyonectria sp. MPI-CAGE-AT-0026]|nr:hypothetical protein BKA56DRAFT_196542 [Ilyonectria sp. MPI-CAGE-AT-0026]